MSNATSEHSKGKGSAVPAVSVSYVQDAEFDYALDFTICTLVADEDRYHRMLNSFAAQGFSDMNSEFIALDNRTVNRFDGYSWLRRVLPQAKGRWIVFCHDDVELVNDGFEDLVSCLNELTAKDPRWSLAGNAGHAHGNKGFGRRSKVFYLLAPDRSESRHGRPPERVESLDENFFVLNRSNLVVGSLDLSGYHFYATDLVRLGEILGTRAYVVPFELLHHSHGTRDKSFVQARRAFARKHRRYRPMSRIDATTGPVWLGPFGYLDRWFATKVDDETGIYHGRREGKFWDAGRRIKDMMKWSAS